MKLLHVRLLVIVGVLSVSLAAILVKLSDATPLHNAFYRMFFSALIMTPVVIRQRKDFLGIHKKTYLWMSVSGMALALHFFTWFVSLDHTPIANSMVLICMSPIFTVTGGALIFGTKFRKEELIMTFTAITGSVIMALHTGGFEQGEMFGNAMALLGSFLIGVYLLIGNHVRKDVPTNVYTFFVYAFASLTLFVLSLFDTRPLLVQTNKSWGIFILLAIIPTLMGHSLFSYSLKYVKAAFISTAVLFEPVLTILFAAFIFREYPDAIQILGGTIILVSLIAYTASGLGKTKKVRV